MGILEWLIKKMVPDPEPLPEDASPEVPLKETGYIDFYTGKPVERQPDDA